MTNSNFTVLSVDDLVDRFAEIGIEQRKKIYDRDTRGFNLLYDKMKGIDNELRGRGVDARRALMRLHDHPDPQVRLQAARSCLEALGKSGIPPQAYDARTTLSALDDGTSMLN